MAWAACGKASLAATVAVLIVRDSSQGSLVPGIAGIRPSRGRRGGAQGRRRRP